MRGAAMAASTEVDDVVGRVLFDAHAATRKVESRLELEAADPRVAPLFAQAKALRKAIAATVAELALDGAEVRTP